MADLEQPLSGTVDMSGVAKTRTSNGMGPFAAQAGAAGGAHLAQDPTFRDHVQSEFSAGAGSVMQSSFSAVQGGVVRAFGEINKYIQMGPTGVSVLCTFGAVSTSAVGVLGLFELTSMITQPATYVLNLYLFFFGVAMLLIELDVSRLRQFAILGALAPLVTRWQSWIFQEVHLISSLRGRGFFYLFVGLFCLTECWFCLTFIVGLFNCLNGVLCIGANLKSPNHTSSLDNTMSQHSMSQLP